ncbi:hypothetical protein QQ020_33340 [Fulvivirgaceae bacterium BMA12]|uniref:Porin n=1 Tax=Agaribacillus aureus TaxID=3051825 RepID=A0ABT8LGS4_9BACT|nr:hypothetical protein [Fulvivirgaceae bacterium BMA12]
MKILIGSGIPGFLDRGMASLSQLMNTKNHVRHIPMVAALLMATITAGAQDLEDFVGSYTGENGKGFMQPLADAFGANMNSGLYHSAKIDSGFQLYIGVVTTTALIADNQKTFTATTEGLFDPETTADAPTIFGAVEGTTVEGVAGTTYNFPGGFDLNILPLAIPQLHIGNLFGTEATFRYIAVDLGDNFGKLNVFGWGVRHSISQYFNRASVDIAVGYFQETFDVGDIVEAKSSLIGIQASKDVGVVTFFGGLGFEDASLDISYEYDDGETVETIAFDLEGSNSVRFTAGLTLRLGVIRINTNINLADQTVFAAGLGFQF